MRLTSPVVCLLRPLTGGVLSTLLLGGCGFGLTLADVDDDGPGPGGLDTSIDGDADTDTDADSDTDADADTDTDTDADGDADTDTDTDADSDTDPQVLAIDSVAPEYGTTSGGDQVVITGGPYDSTAKVWFGGTEGTVVSATSSRITVTTPTNADEEQVDVRVRTSSGEGTLASGYSYFEDGTGKTGVIGELFWLDQVGTYWGSAATDSGSAWFTFVHPVDGGYGELFFASGTDVCTSNYTSTATISAYDPGLADVDLDTPTGATVTLSWDSADGTFSLADLPNNRFTTGGGYDLPTINPAGLPSFGVTDIVAVPSSFSVNTPSIGGSNAPRVSKNSFNLTWSGSGGDYMVAYLAMWNSGGTDWGEVVTCVLRDDGSYTVPSTAFSSWPTGRQLDILLGRAKIAGGTVPFNNATSEFAGVYMVYGATLTQ